MKRYTLFILAVVLGMLGIQTASAQQTQDALYIYRNDGGFNGFFFADIDRIEYSKVDTLGVEHDDYVVQEVYALDTLYRIPLNAIDSVTFVTPETIYKKDVVHTTESDMWNYVISSDSVSMLKLATNTPSGMIPKVGDKIVTTKSREFLPGGFYGVVKKVSTSSGYITVNCEVPELTELFDQVVFKAAAVGSPDGGSSARTRGEESATNEFEIPAVNFMRSLGGGDINYDLGNNWSLKGNGSMELGVNHKVNLRAFMAIRWALGMNLDITQRVETTSWFDLKLSGEVGGQVDIHTYLLNGWEWIPDTPFAIEWEGGFSISASGKVELNVHRKHVSSSYFMVQYNDSFYDEERSQCVESFHTLGTEAETSLSGELSATAGPYFSVYVCLAKKEVGKMGLRFDAGTKVNLSAELNMTDYLLAAVPSMLPAVMMAKPTALYDYLNRDGSVKFGRFFKIDFEAQLANIKKLKYTKTLYDNFSTPAKRAWIDFEGGLVPKFSTTQLIYDKEKNKMTAQVALTRKTLMGNKVGFAAYYTKSGKQAARSLYDTQYKYDGEVASFNKWSQTFENLHGGKELTFYPIVTLLPPLNIELLASPASTYTIPGEMEVTPEALDFEAKGGTGKFTVKDNLDKEEDTYERKAEINFGDDKVKPWFKGEWSGDDYTVIVDKSDSSQVRTATINFSISNKDKSIDLQKSVTISQAAGEVQDYGVYADPTELTFNSAESTQDVDIHCDWDNVPFTHYGVRLREGVDWIKATAKGGQIHVTPAPNFEFKTREGYIDCYVRQKDRPESEWVFMPVKVTQGPPIKFDPAMKFVGKWTYESSTTDYYVEYTFRADGTYYSKWNTPDLKREEIGIFVVNSYSEEENGNVVMVASVNERYTITGGGTDERTQELKLVKSSGYVNGVWEEDATRDLQIGWNTYRKRN